MGNGITGGKGAINVPHIKIPAEFFIQSGESAIPARPGVYLRVVMVRIISKIV